MTKYKCPKCNKFGMDEDGRAKTFMCYYDSCNTVIKFTDYNPIAAVLTGKLPKENDVSLPSRAYPLPVKNGRGSDERVSNLLKFIYEDNKLKKD